MKHADGEATMKNLNELSTGDRFRWANPEPHEPVGEAWVVVDAAPGGRAVRVIKAAELGQRFGCVNTVQGCEPVMKIEGEIR